MSIDNHECRHETIEALKLEIERLQAEIATIKAQVKREEVLFNFARQMAPMFQRGLETAVDLVMNAEEKSDKYRDALEQISSMKPGQNDLNDALQIADTAIL